MMSERSHHFSLQFIVRVFFVALVLVVGSHGASTRAETLRISYSALVPSGAPFWIAQELKLFEREGLKVDLVYISEKGREIKVTDLGDETFVRDFDRQGLYHTIYSKN